MQAVSLAGRTPNDPKTVLPAKAMTAEDFAAQYQRNIDEKQ